MIAMIARIGEVLETMQRSSVSLNAEEKVEKKTPLLPVSVYPIAADVAWGARGTRT